MFNIKRETDQIVELLFDGSQHSYINDEDVSDAQPGALASQDFSEPLGSSGWSGGSECTVTESDESLLTELGEPLSNDNLRRNLTEWTIKHNITNAATDDLFKILGKHILGFPLCARTESAMNDGDTPVTKKDLLLLEERMVQQIKKSERKILKGIDHNQASIKGSLTQILQEVKQKTSNRRSNKNILPKVPFDNFEDFKAFEQQIQNDPSKFDDLVEELSLIAAPSAEKFIKNVWRKVMSDNAAQHLCWKGTADKLAASALSMTAALKSSLLSKFPHSADIQFERTSILFFQHAKGRNEKKKIYGEMKSKSQILTRPQLPIKLEKY